MKDVVFHSEAEDEARDAANYYENIRVSLGAKFQADLDTAIARIRSNPFMYAAESGDMRICPLQGFPYSIYYANLADYVWVVAVGHQSRRPGYWAHRLTN